MFTEIHIQYTCGSTFYVGLTGTFQMLIQKSTGMDKPLWCFVVVVFVFRSFLFCYFFWGGGGGGGGRGLAIWKA